MKNLFCLLTSALVLLACQQRAVPSGSVVVHTDTVSSLSGFASLFTQSDAEKILGEASHLEDSSSTLSGSAITYSVAYKANAIDPKSAKTGVIYILIQRYDNLASAAERYRFVKTANQKNGIVTLENVGDEAYYHSDNQNFYFIMARKGTKMLTLKVNKITNNTSKQEFDRVARQLVAIL